MKLRTKTTIFFGIFFLTVTLAVVIYVEQIVSDTLKKQTVHNFRIIAEQSEGTYFAFLGQMKTRVVDWTSDAMIQRISKELVSTSLGSPERARLAKEFGDYMREKKMPYDKTILSTDILDHNGIVIASTKPERIGNNEKQEGLLVGVNKFSETIDAKFGEVFFGGIVFDSKNPNPIINATVRPFTFDNNGIPQPLDAVILVSFANTEQIASAIGTVSGDQIIKTNKRTSSQAFLESYKTSNIYLVNNENIMVTPSRYIKDISVKQKVNTFPVSECLNNGKEISEEYDNYQGIRVLGSSMCFKDSGLVLIVEIQKDEVYSPLVTLTHITIVGGVIVLIFGIIVALFFVRRPLARIEDIVLIAKRVTKGDLEARADEDIKDEIGYLATSFNNMITSVSNARKELEASNRDIEEKSKLLEKDIVIHEEQEKKLEASKKATMHIIEDVWNIKNKLQSEGNKLQTVIASIGDGLILIDREYKIVLVNPKVLELFVISNEEIIGKNLQDIMKLWKGKEELPFDEWPVKKMFIVNSTVDTNVHDKISLTTERRDIPLPVEFDVSPLEGGLSGGVIIVRDITEDRELDEAKSGFISTASHQLRTPLTSMRWFSEMLLAGDAGEINEEQKSFIGRIYQSTDRMIALVNLLLQIARIESGRVKVEPIPIDLKTITEGVETMTKVNFENKKQKIDIKTEPTPLPLVVNDKDMLWQVIQNLLSNANRYSPVGSTIFVNMIQKGDYIEYSVKDSGIGIPKNQQSRLFEKFFRADNAISAVPEGSGLGLSLVKSLVEGWGGKIWFETKEGSGTTFFFTVPLLGIKQKEGDVGLAV